MHYAVARKDGSVSIMLLVEADDPHAEIAKWHADDAATVASVIKIDPSVIPADRTFRNAWTVQNGTITHDMRKARNLHRDKMRVARAPQLSALDVAYQQADEKGDVAGKAAIAAKKQALRDVTKHIGIDRAADISALKKVWPDILNGDVK